MYEQMNKFQVTPIKNPSDMNKWTNSMRHPPKVRYRRPLIDQQNERRDMLQKKARPQNERIPRDILQK